MVGVWFTFSDYSRHFSPSSPLSPRSAINTIQPSNRSTMARQLRSIECSAQPLCMSFHPLRDVVAAGLVDGTVEVHELLALDHEAHSKAANESMDRDDDDSDMNSKPDDDDDDDIETILSSVFVAKQSTRAAASTKMLAKVDGDTAAAAGKASQGPSCRAVLFSDSSHQQDAAASTSSGGEHLFTACNGGSLRCLDTSRMCSLDPSMHDSSIVWSVDNAHHVGICKLYQLPQTSSAGPLLVSGDDVGAVRLWDVRLCGGDGDGNGNTHNSSNNKQNPFDNLMKPPQGCVMQWKVNQDYITDFACNNDGSHLLTTSADGTLSVFDVRFVHRKHTPRSVILPQVDLNTTTNPTPQSKKNVNTWETSGYAQSDNQEDELLSLCLLKNLTKVCVSSQQGILSLFSYNTWGDISDRFPGHPQSIDALLKIDEDTILTGSSDGLVRAVQLLPNALLGVLGSHEGFPVEALGWTVPD
ncbi:hypothetical protein ACHAXN_005762 [Cyclotella atomus]